MNRHDYKILGGGITSSSAADGVSVSGSKVRLGHAAAGSGLSDFTANRFLYMAGFYLQIGGTAGNNLFKFNANGNYDIAGKLTIGNDAAYTTQGTSAVINQTTNGGIAIVPNGTGAFTLNVPDGTTAGGIARGQYAVDLQLGGRNQNHQVSSGNYSFTAGRQNQASGLYSFIPGGNSNAVSGQSSGAMGDANNVSGYNCYAIGNENVVSANAYAAAIGRANTISAQQSYIMGSLSTITATYSYLNGTGGKCQTIGQNVFARGLGLNGSSPSNNAGTSQIISGICGADTKIATALVPKASGSTIIFNPTNVVSGTEIPFYIPSTSNNMFVIEADIQIRVVGINGTATGVTVGDIKQVKIRQTGKIVAGVLTFLSALTTTLDYEDASLNTCTFAFNNSTNRVNIYCTNATFAGGGTLDLIAMATYKISESSLV